MADILKFTALDLAWRERQIFLLAFQGLHTSHLIGRNHPFAAFGQGRRFTIHLTHVSDFGVKLLVRRRCQPIANQVRFEIPLLSRREAWRREIPGTILRAMISSASSRLLHWLTGRPPSAGGSDRKSVV